MNKLIKLAAISLLAITVSACSSKPSNTSNFIKVGKVKSVNALSKSEKPSWVSLLAISAVGGVIGHQFGDGSGKKWATGVGAVGSGLLANELLSSEWKEIRYVFYFPSDNTTIAVDSKDLTIDVFPNDLVIVYKKGKSYNFDAYGKYTNNRYKQLKSMVDNGKIP